MVRYLIIDNKHPKIDFARKCSFNNYLSSLNDYLRFDLPMHIVDIRPVLII
jgi:hypothetical protein